MKPVRKYNVTTPFGKPGPWMAGYHTGDDYACPEGTWVRATKGGRVVDLGYNSAYGNYITVHSWHNGKRIRHMYCHLSKFRTALGKRVRAGSLLGLSGSTGNATGPHVHYEERVFPFGYYDHQKPVLQDWRA